MPLKKRSAFAAPLPTGHERRCENKSNEDAEAEDKCVRPQFCTLLERGEDHRIIRRPVCTCVPLLGHMCRNRRLQRVDDEDELKPASSISGASSLRISRMRSRRPSRSQRRRGCRLRACFRLRDRELAYTIEVERSKSAGGVVSATGGCRAELMFRSCSGSSPASRTTRRHKAHCETSSKCRTPFWRFAPRDPRLPQAG
jgi:hypothetical protein